MAPNVAYRAVLALALQVSFASPNLLAAVRLKGGKERIDLTFVGQIGWDSNIYSTSEGRGDTVTTASAAIEYQRRAGTIGMDASVGIEAGEFAETSSENYVNPRASVEFTKSTGRTTGSWATSAVRKSQGDVAANLRAELWDYETALKLRYPVIESYSLAGSIGYSQSDYLNSPVLVDLGTFHASTDLFYALNSQRDLVAGYRLRVSDSAIDTLSRDHAVTIGLSGKIFPKVNGTIRAGFQTRKTTGPGIDDENDGLTAATSATWTMDRRSSLTAQFSSDFATTSTDISTESTALTLDWKLAVNSKWSTTAGVAYGTLDFLGPRGAGRHDTYATASGALSLRRNERLSASLSYSYLCNWSTLALADYSRHTITIGITVRL